MKSSRVFRGKIRLRIVSADLSDTLSLVAQNDITLQQVTRKDGLCVTATVEYHDYEKLCRILEKRGVTVETIDHGGIYWTLRSFWKRPVFLLGCLLVLGLGFFLPSRIWFFQVTGNSKVPSQLILEKANEAGICFGMSRRDIRSESIKNALLEQIPELQWAGVTTQGALATIEVREGEKQKEGQQMSGMVGSMIAVRDGIVTDCTVTRGTPLCVTGQAVKEGEVLISGYTDCGGVIHAAMADGEVYGKTVHQLDVSALTVPQTRKNLQHKETRYSLLIGKKIIKCYNDSGILDAGCVKICKYKYLTLPGGFQLPAAVICEEVFNYDTAEAESLVSSVQDWMVPSAAAYLKSQMVAGKITSDHTAFKESPGVCSLQGMYFCEEMIGQLKSEEIILSGTKTD